jgi:hypothetical protein
LLERVENLHRAIDRAGARGAALSCRLLAWVSVAGAEADAASDAEGRDVRAIVFL